MVKDEELARRLFNAIDRFRTVRQKTTKLLVALEDCLNPYTYIYVKQQLEIRLRIALEAIEEAINANQEINEESPTDI